MGLCCPSGAAGPWGLDSAAASLCCGLGTAGGPPRAWAQRVGVTLGWGKPTGLQGPRGGEGQSLVTEPKAAASGHTHGQGQVPRAGPQAGAVLPSRPPSWPLAAQHVAAGHPPRGAGHADGRVTHRGTQTPVRCRPAVRGTDPEFAALAPRTAGQPRPGRSSPGDPLHLPVERQHGPRPAGQLPVGLGSRHLTGRGTQSHGEPLGGTGAASGLTVRPSQRRRGCPWAWGTQLCSSLGTGRACRHLASPSAGPRGKGPLAALPDTGACG